MGWTWAPRPGDNLCACIMVSLRGLFRKRTKSINTSALGSVKAAIEQLKAAQGIVKGRADLAGISLSSHARLRNHNNETTAAGRHFHETLDKITKMAIEQSRQYRATGNLGAGPLELLQTKGGATVVLRANYKRLVNASANWQKPKVDLNVLNRRTENIASAMHRLQAQFSRLKNLSEKPGSSSNTRPSRAHKSLNQVRNNMQFTKELKQRATAQLQQYKSKGVLDPKGPFVVHDGRVYFHPSVRPNVRAAGQRFKNRNALLNGPTEFFGSRHIEEPKYVTRLRAAPVSTWRQGYLGAWNAMKKYDKPINNPVPRIRHLLDLPFKNLTKNNKAFLDHWLHQTRWRGERAYTPMDWERKLLRKVVTRE